MKLRPSPGAAATLVLVIPHLLLADEESAPGVAATVAPKPVSAAPSAGFVNDWLRDRSVAFSPWDIGGQFRAREEHKEYFAAPGQPGAVDFRKAGGDADNSYLLLRTKVHLGYSPVPWVQAYVEGRSSSSTGDDRNPNPESDGPIDLHQAYFALGNSRQFPLSAKVGRQELVYGDERLVGASDWSNVGRVFDAARLRYEISDFGIDAFVSRPVLVNDDHFNISNDYEFLSGLYASTRTLIPKQETQLYFLARNAGTGSLTANAGGSPQSGGASPRDIYTFGLRVKSLPGKHGGWDYEAELAGQIGCFKETVSSASLDHEALAAHVAGGYTWSGAPATPRLGLEYNYASGDRDPNDDKHQTFDNLFPTNHKSYGYMDFVSWQNIHNLRLSGSLKPFKPLTASLDYHAFWLADTHDAFYTVAGAPRAAGGYGVHPAYPGYVGSEVDLILTYALRPFASLQGGYGHFFAGGYVKSSLAGSGGATDADFLYGQFTCSF